MSDTPEGIEARAAMETILQKSAGRITELLDESFSEALVFQGGGNEIIGNNLQAKILEASKNALQRLYSQFPQADHVGWEKAYSRAKQGAPYALKAVGYDGEPANNSICKAILGQIAGGKKGLDIRDNFESAPYGWPRDTIDGAIQTLLVSGLLASQDEQGKNIEPRELERKAIGKAMFKVVAITITTAQRIQIRKLFQKMGYQAKQGEELVFASPFLHKVMELADQAGGDAPKPNRPDTASPDEILLLAGNEQLLAIYNNREDLIQSIHDWNEIAKRITNRWPVWETLQQLLKYVKGLKDTDVYMAQSKNISAQRLLLSEPDQIAPLSANVAQLLRDALNQLDAQYLARHQEGMEQLRNDANWKQLEPEQRNELLSEQMLTEGSRPKINVETTEDILKTLNQFSLSMFADRVAAMAGRFENVALGAAEMCEPQAQFIQVPRRTLKTEVDVDTWLEDVKLQLKAALQYGPVIIK